MPSRIIQALDCIPIEITPNLHLGNVFINSGQLLAKFLDMFFTFLITSYYLLCRNIDIHVFINLAIGFDLHLLIHRFIRCTTLHSLLQVFIHFATLLLNHVHYTQCPELFKKRFILLMVNKE